jgi:hypothetical protein
MKIKTYYINEGRNFDISQSDRNAIELAGFKFYTAYKGYRKGKSIYLFPTADIQGEEIRFDYNSDIFVN